MEDKGADTGSRETTTGVSQDREETAGSSRTEDTDTYIEDEGEGRTEERTEICAETTTGVSQDREETTGSSRTEDTDTCIEDEEEGRTEERTEICAGMMTGVSQDRGETAGNSRTEDTDTCIEDEEEGRTEERTEISAGTPLMATHAYTNNQDSPVRKEIDLRQWDTLIFKGEQGENKHWWLVEDRNGQVGYAPVTFLTVILDTTDEEDESNATNNGQEFSTEEHRIGQEGEERRKSYSAAVIDGIKRKSRIFVGDSIVRKTDSRLSKVEDIVVCLG